MRKIACATLSCDGFKETHFRESFKKLPKIPIRYVEFNCWYPGDLTNKSIENINSKCEEKNLKPIAIYGTHFGGETRGEICKDVAHKIRMMEVAKAVGCHRIVATGLNGRPEGSLMSIISVLKEIVPMAEDMNINICLENHFNNTLEKIEDYREIFNCISSDHVGLCVDTGHFYASGVSLSKIVDIFENKINHIHLKDCKEKGKDNFVNYGEGEVDHFGFMKKVVDNGYQGFMTLELELKNKSEVVKQLKQAKKMFEPFTS